MGSGTQVTEDLDTPHPGMTADENIFSSGHLLLTSSVGKHILELEEVD